MTKEYVIDNGKEVDFLKENKGKDKLFPGGPECVYKGITIPELIAFTESGGINGYILKAISERLDDLNIYTDDRKRGQIPFALIDGQQSRFDLDFLKYINSRQQSETIALESSMGMYYGRLGTPTNKMVVSRCSSLKKERNIPTRLNTFQHNIHLMQSNIIPIVNATWHEDFGDVAGN